MSTADTALSISIKMAPGPEHRQEPVAPDKIVESDHTAAAAAAATTSDDVVVVENIETTTTDNNNDDDSAGTSATAVVVAEQSSSIEIASTNFAVAADSTNQSSPSNSGVGNKQVSIGGSQRDFQSFCLLE